MHRVFVSTVRLIGAKFAPPKTLKCKMGMVDVIFQAVVKNHLTTQRCFNTFVINELRFLA